MRTLGIALTGLALVGVVALAGIVLFWLQERRRVHQVKKWVSDFLIARYGDLPRRLSISCLDDFLSPVIVRFDHPISGIRHRMQFSCPGSVATFELLSEREELR